MNISKIFNKNNNINNINNKNNIKNIKNLNNLIIENNVMGKVRLYLLILTAGYFVIKIVFAPFNIFPNKYNYKSLQVKVNAADPSYNLLNDYTPGVWNSELTDYLIMIVLAILLFVFKLNNTFPLDTNNTFINIPLWGFFMLGLIIPPILQDFYNSSIKLEKVYNGIAYETDVDINKELKKLKILLH